MTSERLWLCEFCSVKNPVHVLVCDHCGRERPEPTRGKPIASCWTCDTRAPWSGRDGRPPERLHDVPLNADGTCSKTGGYPATAVCPFSCPECRGQLTWHGACERCHGGPDREHWTMTGDRYELEAGHWVKTAIGPRPCATRQDAHEAIDAIKRHLALIYNRAE